MFDVFMYSFNAVMPILLLMALGYLLKKIHFASDEFFKKLNAMVFRLFIPVLLFYNVYRIEKLSSINWKGIVYIAVAILLAFVLGLVAGHLATKNRDRIGVIAQCTFRSNHAIVGITLTQSLGGAEAVAFTSVASAVAIPLFNGLAVALLSYFSSSGEKPSVKKTFLKTAQNPLIIGVFIGLLCLVVRIFLPKGADGSAVFNLERDLPFLMNAVSSLSKVASPLSLIVLGARFDFSSVKSMLKEITVSVFMRLVAVPALAIGGAYLLTKYTDILSITATEYPALICVFGSPVAVSSAVMVGEIGGDDQLATQLVVWTSALSMITLFITVFMLKSFNLI